MESENICVDCNLCMDVRRGKKKLDAEHENVYDAIKGYEVNDESGLLDTVSRQRRELSRLVCAIKSHLLTYL